MADGKIQIVIECDSSAAAEQVKNFASGIADARVNSERGATAAGQLAGETGKLADETKKAGEETKKFTSHGRAQYLLFSQLDRIVPGLGRMIHAAFAGPIGAAISLAAAVGAVYEKLKAFNAELDRQGRIARNADFFDAITERQKVLDNAAAAASDYRRALANIAEKENDLTTKLENELKAMQAVAAARQSLAGAEKEKTLAQIKLDEALGKITPGEAERRRAEAEKKSIADAQRASEAAADAERKRKESDIAKLEQEFDEINRRVQDLSNVKSRIEKHLAMVNLNPSEQQKKIQEAQDKYSEAEQAYNKFVESEISTSRFLLPFGNKQQIEHIARTQPHALELEKKRDEAKRQLDAAQKQMEQYNAAFTGAGALQAHEVEKELADAEARAKEIATIRAQMREEIEQARAAADVSNPQSPRALAEAEAKTKISVVDINERAAAADRYQRDFETLQRFDAGKAASPEQLRAAVSAINELNGALRDQTNVIYQIVNLREVVNELARAQRLLAARQANTRAVP